MLPWLECGQRESQERLTRAPLPPAVYGFANVSGANLNPAVSFALMCTGHMTWWKTLSYMVMQVWRAQLRRALRQG